MPPLPQVRGCRDGRGTRLFSPPHSTVPRRGRPRGLCAVAERQACAVGREALLGLATARAAPEAQREGGARGARLFQEDREASRTKAPRARRVRLPRAARVTLRRFRTRRASCSPRPLPASELCQPVRCAPAVAGDENAHHGAHLFPTGATRGGRGWRCPRSSALLWMTATATAARRRAARRRTAQRCSALSLLPLLPLTLVVLLMVVVLLLLLLRLRRRPARPARPRVRSASPFLWATWTS